MTLTLKLRQQRENKLDYIFLIFLTGCLLGWIYEVILCWCIDGFFQNRGVLYGPWLPIYGFGTLIIYSMKSFKKHPALLFLLCGLSAGIVEYITGWISIHVFGLRLWDYSSMFLNIDGIVCLASVLCFSILGLVFQYILEPLFNKKYKQISKDSTHTFCITIFILFLIDCLFSVLFRTPITY